MQQFILGKKENSLFFFLFSILGSPEVEIFFYSLSLGDKIKRGDTRKGVGSSTPSRPR